MKILYGVQGTGNGHLSRAMAMAAAFTNHADIQVSWLISGRDNSRQYTGISSYLWREGLSLITDNGRVSIRKTLKKNNLRQFKKDIRELNLTGFDRVLCDYEPVVAHAARRKGIPTWGISHQHAFNYKIPIRGSNVISSTIMKRFAPLTHGIGLHWHHFDQAILPPILHVDKPPLGVKISDNKILVYLPMENAQSIINSLSSLHDYEFYFYHPENLDSDRGNIHLRAISINGFKKDLQTSHAVICNSGFELISECLYMGKSVMTKPLKGQMEQLSNAEALSVLGYATVVNEINTLTIKKWLGSNPKPIEIAYPDVARRLAQWIADDCKDDIEAMANELWQGVTPN